jgi:uracil permease
MQLSVKNLSLSTQHALAMFGGTILIPILMGLPPSLGLFCAGVGTLIYHFCTKNMIPIFIGSSAAYLAAFIGIKNSTSIGVALGSFIGAAITYFIASLIVAYAGYKVVTKVLPQTVAGSIIIVIGISLVPVALLMAKSNYLLALITALCMIFYCSINKGIFKVIPVLMTIVTGYIVALFMGVVDFSPVLTAPWISMPGFITPIWDIGAIEIMMIIALISMLEHIGELTTNGIVVKNNHFENPGLHRSLFGNGLSLLIAGLFGGSPTTTYGENTGVIAITKNANPALIRGAAVIAICLSFIGKFGALLSTIPMPVIGGVSFMLFGMITMAGITTLKESNVNMLDFRHAVVIFVPIFIGVASIMADNPLQFAINQNLTLSGLSLAAIVGIGLNLFFNLIEYVLHKNNDNHDFSESCIGCRSEEASKKEDTI